MADISVQMTADETSVQIGESISIDVTVTGTRSADNPQILNTKDFDIISSGTSSQFQIINGNMSSSKVFQYSLLPRKKGRFTIGPAIVNVDGKRYQSSTIDIEISEGGSYSGTIASETTEKNSHISVEISNAAPYLNQQIIYTIRFQTRVPVQNANLTPPDFDGFWVEKMGDAKTHEKVVNGQLWNITEIKWALFPSKTGEIKIPSASLTADVVVKNDFNERSFFNTPFFDQLATTKRQVFNTEQLTINVKPLPEENKPAGFSNLVGTFNVNVGLSSNEVKVGDSTTLTVTIKGNGNIRDIPFPHLPQSQEYKLYEDEPTVKINTNANGLEGSKTFTTAIVPLKKGTITIPAISISSFDPKENKYTNLSTSSITLKVLPSDNPMNGTINSYSVDKQGVKILGKDISPIFSNESALANNSISPVIKIIFIILSIIPVIGFIISVFYYKYLSKISSDSGFIRRSKAMKKAVQKIKTLKQDTEFYNNASLLLREFIGDKINIDGRALTSMDIKTKLTVFKLNNDLINNIIRFLSECDAGLYGGKILSNENYSMLIENLNKLINRIDKEIK